MHVHVSSIKSSDMISKDTILGWIASAVTSSLRESNIVLSNDPNTCTYRI